jgi:hypothetical protein
MSLLYLSCRATSMNQLSLLCQGNIKGFRCSPSLLCRRKQICPLFVLSVPTFVKRTPPDYTHNVAALLSGSGSGPRQRLLGYHRGLYSSYPVYAPIPLREPIGTSGERPSCASTASEPSTPKSRGGLPWLL